MIRLQQLNLNLGSKTILQQAELTVHDGHKLAVVGANGAGKSTLFKLLLGQLVPDQGELYVPKNWRIAHMAQEVAAARRKRSAGDVLQGAAADCNSAGETHAWFDSRVAHHFPDIPDD